MSKSVVISLGSGDLNNGFPNVTARLSSGNSLAQQFVGSLPAAPSLVELCKNWQLNYKNICGRQQLRSLLMEEDDELEIDEDGVTNVSVVSFYDVCQKVQENINHWLKSGEFLNIERQLRSQLQPAEEIRVMIETNDDLLRRLPWHRWDFFNDYPKAEMALSQLEYKSREFLHSKLLRKKVRILAVLGNSQGIDLDTEIKFLDSLLDAEIVFLVNPSRQEFNTHLWQNPGWDILFFAGHSHTEGATGRIYINENQKNNSLTIEQLEEALKAAIDNGLQLAIFNSCDGLGLASALEKLNIPTVIVMREPVPNLVAQEFFNYFLTAFAVERLSLYLAVQQARRKLQGLEDDFPGASWLPVICQNPAVEPPSWLKLGGVPPCPYRGLFAFREEDAHLFFGREQFTQNLVTASKRKPLVAVVGSSGSGKSSVVFAGLVPQLRQDSYLDYQIISFRPGHNPIEALAGAFASRIGETLLDFHTRNINKDINQRNQNSNLTARRLIELELEIALRQDNKVIYKIIESFVQQNPKTRLVLIADQFEELYTLCSEEERRGVLDALLNAVQFAPAFTLVLTLRADFYGYALSYRPFSDALQGAVLNLGPMNREELRAAIENPARQMQIRLEKELINKLIDDMDDQSGRLPLLEFALTQLWSKQTDGWLTHQSYNEIGGVEEALASHAETVYAQLSEVDRNRAQQVFMQLVRLGEGVEVTRRLATRDEVKSENWDLVRHLADARLVVTNRNESSGEETVEIVHEALIRSWGRLEGWIQVDGEFRYWQEQLRSLIRQWENSGNDEGALLRGKPLLDAEYWQQQRFDELNSFERHFIELSLALRDNELKKHKRRRQLTILGLTGGLVGALILAGVAWWKSLESGKNEVKATSESSAALFALNKDLDSLKVAIQAGQKLQKLGLAPPETEMQVKLTLRQAVYQVKERNRLSKHLGDVYCVSFSADGKTIASASKDKTIKLWNLDGQVLHTLEDSSAVRSVSFSPDSKILASGSQDGTIKLWNLDGQLLHTLKGHNDGVRSVSFSPNGKILASGSQDGTIKLWNLDGQLLQTLTGHSGGVNSVSFSPDGKILASASLDKTIKLWNLNGQLLDTLTGHGDAVNSLSFSPDGKTLVSGSDDYNVKLWNRNNRSVKTLETLHKGPVTSVTFSHDGKTIASASWDGTIQVWSSDGGSFVQNYHAHNDIVYSISFSHDGKTLISGSRDNTIKIWNQSGQKPPVLTGHKAAVTSVSFSPNSKAIASASLDQTIKIWNRDGQLLRTLTGHKAAVTSVSFSPNSKMIASGSEDRTIKIWNLDGQELATLTGHEAAITSVSFSPDGKTIASASLDGMIKLWSLDGQELRTFAGHKAALTSVSFSHDGKTIASASLDGMIKLWNLDGQELATLTGHEAAITSVSFSPDGKTIASASLDGMIKLWNLDGQELKTLTGHLRGVTSISFSPDSKTIASSEDNIIKLWSLDGEELSTITGRHKGAINSISFSPDGKTLVSASQDKTLILWNLNINDLLVRGCLLLQDYLKTNPNNNEDIHRFCDDIKTSRL
ncbi:CHAT domain-containing protein [Brasilonema sp. UFV-L1]|uniref:nSTAND1 domain-containing NTPase n=1 Tax=Brasilonema sp. UFV-L1 TaxID=2234130 RepID=UPI00145F5CE1|nr:CHAT domain-containing protein [Brasilonema sp. UFV-L1]NMG09341.1 hypothetical protein [Brasilonema sp. UFV-L1]